MAKINKVKINRKMLLQFRDLVIILLRKLSNEGATCQQLIDEVYSMMTQMSDSMFD